MSATLSRGVFLRATMEHANLTGVNADSARFPRAGLAYATLRGAMLAGADFTGATLAFADLSKANLAFAELERATLLSANLGGAILEGADLSMTNLDGATLAGAALRGASLYRTLLTECVDLHLASGLDELQHLGPSVMDFRTLRTTAAFLPAALLERLDIPVDVIDWLRAGVQGVTTTV